MDHVWAAQQLKEFQKTIDDFYRMLWYAQSEYVDDQAALAHDGLIEEYGSIQGASDRLTSLNPVLRTLMNAAQAGIGDYLEPPEEGRTYEGNYWRTIVKPRVLRAKGIHELGEEARRRMRPDSPDLIADQFHPWVWEAAAPLWYAGSRQEAIHAAARSVNARMQQKRGHHDKSEAALCREFFSPDKPAPGRPRLRFGGYTHTDQNMARAGARGADGRTITEGDDHFLQGRSSFFRASHGKEAGPGVGTGLRGLGNC